MSGSYLKEERQGPLLLWTIDRPERLNALGPTLAETLGQAIAHLKEKLIPAKDPPRLLGILTTPTPQKVWIAGGDLKELAKRPQKAAGHAYAHSLTTAGLELTKLPVPVCMGIDGAAIGGGLEFALMGDMRIATPQANFDFRQLRIGLATAFGGAQRLVHLVGGSLASQWQLLSQVVTAEEAYRRGLVSQLHDNRVDLIKALGAMAKRLAEVPFLSVAHQKQMLALAYRPRTEDELNLFADLWMNPHHKQFLAKFTGED